VLGTFALTLLDAIVVLSRLHTVVSGRLNVAKGLKRTNQIVRIGTS
jgi:hypothetical protein